MEAHGHIGDHMEVHGHIGDYMGAHDLISLGGQGLGHIRGNKDPIRDEHNPIRGKPKIDPTQVCLYYMDGIS